MPGSPSLIMQKSCPGILFRRVSHPSIHLPETCVDSCCEKDLTKMTIMIRGELCSCPKCEWGSSLKSKPCSVKPSFHTAGEGSKRHSAAANQSSVAKRICKEYHDFDCLRWSIPKMIDVVREGSRYQFGWIFGKVPKGGGGSFSIQKFM